MAIGRFGSIGLSRFEGGRFVDAGVLETGSPVRAIVWADVTGDGALDLVAATDAGVRAFAATGGEGMRFDDRTAALGLAGLGGAVHVAAGDFDGDGRGDLFVAAASGPRVLVSRGDAGFVDVTARFDLDEGAVAGVWVDLDGSGALDLAAIAPSSVAVLANPRSGHSAVRVRPSVSGGTAAGAILRVDLDGDGDFGTGLRAAVQVDAATGVALVSAPGLATARVRVDFPGGVGFEAAVVPGGPAAEVGRPSAGSISAVRATARKLVVDGAGLPVAGARIEVAGAPLERVKAPARFAGTRLVGRDPALAALVASRPVAVRVFDPATGVLTAPVRLE